MVFFLATVTVRLFSRVLGADDAPLRPVMSKRGECEGSSSGASAPSETASRSREGAGGGIAEAAQRREQRRQQDNWLALLWLMPNSRPWTTWTA
jgi:hypothetical protein